jgi:hypothetical protein
MLAEDGLSYQVVAMANLAWMSTSSSINPWTERPNGGWYNAVTGESEKDAAARSPSKTDFGAGNAPLSFTYDLWEPSKTMHDGKPVTLERMAQFLADTNFLFAGGSDLESWEAEADTKYVDWAIKMADADGDGKLSKTEGFILALSSDKNDLFKWLDTNSDGYATKEEIFSTYNTIIDDGNKGKFVCNGLEIIDATHGKIDVRAPMGTDGVACGWLIMPSWFYAETVGGIATESECHGNQSATQRRSFWFHKQAQGNEVKRPVRHLVRRHVSLQGSPLSVAGKGEQGVHQKCCASTPANYARLD